MLQLEVPEDRDPPPEIDPLVADSVYALGTAGDESFAFRSDDRGASWTTLLNGLPSPIDPQRSVEFVAPDPGVRDRVWLGYVMPGGIGPVLFRSDDRGLTWFATASGINGQGALEMAFDVLDPDVRLLRTNVGVARTQDGGLTWSDFEQGLPAGPREIVALAADPSVSGRAYALVDKGLFRREPGGVWSELPVVAALNVTPRSLAIDPTNPNRIYLGLRFQGTLRPCGGTCGCRAATPEFR